MLKLTCRLLLLFFVADMCAVSANAQSSAFTATYRGLGSDLVSPLTVAPDGSADYRISLSGLRGPISQITVTSDTHGVWHMPFNGAWLIRAVTLTSSNAEIYFSVFQSSSFQVEVQYADGTSDRADSLPAILPSTLKATFNSLGGDQVGTVTLAPDGLADYRISLSGLRGTPTEVIVRSEAGGIWRSPNDDGYWFIKFTNQNASNADIYFAEWGPSKQFTVGVYYPDGSYDEANSVEGSLPSTLTAVFRGLGADVISPFTFSPDGLADDRITLAGLRGTPSEILLTSETGGVWHTPGNGAWLVGLSDLSGSSGELNFSHWSGQNFFVRIGYPDGTYDQANTTYEPTDEKDVGRFLQQSTFGPTTALINQVKQSGIATYIEQQKTAPMQAYPDLAFWPTTRPTTCIDTCQRDNYTYYQLQKHFFSNGIYGEDQLRQRVAFALSEILVTSQVDLPYPAWMRPYQQLLYTNSFGNFRQLLYDVTLNPAMGRFLDMVNSRCQTPIPANVAICRTGLTSQPNENYAREVLQLFSIGTYRLNQDGSRILDSSGNPIPTYDQKTVEEFARVFTGWVLAPNLPAPAELGDPTLTVPNYRDPMVPHKDTQNRENYHDQGSKTLLNGIVLPSGQTAAKDLNDAIDNIAYNENVAPFISKQLIQHLITSNPSPAYVQRIANLFTVTSRSSDQLFQVVRAILLDPEARNGHQDPATAPNYGKLREPALLIAGVIRAFGGTTDGVLNTLTVGGSPMGSTEMNQDMFNPASVLNYFPPSARVPGEIALGPEFAIFSSLSSLRRDNFINRVVFSTIPVSSPNRPVGTSINLAPYDSLASNPDQLLDSLNTLLLNGSMSAEMRQTIKTAVQTLPSTDMRGRVRAAVYLILTSSQYQVER